MYTDPSWTFSFFFHKAGAILNKKKASCPHLRLQKLGSITCTPFLAEDIQTAPHPVPPSSTPRPGTAKITQQSQQPLKEQAGHQRYLHTSTILPRSVQMMLAGMLLKRDLGNLLIKAIQTALIDLITYLLGAYLKPPQKILNMSE